MKKDTDCHVAAEEEKALGARHGQIHPQVDEHFHGHFHGQICGHAELNEPGAGHARHHQVFGRKSAKDYPSSLDMLTIRCHSGISGDILLAGLAVLNILRQGNDPDSHAGRSWLAALTAAIMPELEGKAILERHAVNGISGWRARVDLPRVHEHRNLADVKKIIDCSAMAEAAKERAGRCFELLAACEAAAHGVGPDEVHFHEVGALDSILDTCVVCEMYERLGAPALRCSPLPVADGQISCAHGILPAPAPAVMRLLEGVPVAPFEGGAQAGELVTPTGIALLRALGASFGAWPEFAIKATTLVYGQREFPGAANGVIFALGAAGRQ